MHRLAIAAFATILAAGCSQPDPGVSNLQGQPESAAIARFGQPTSSYPDGSARWLVWDNGSCRRAVEVRLGTINRYTSTC